ncbi:2OG-Fe(II) oxygenase family protein [Actinomadura rugatobispora]|uniref:2OG-Fe(II) oxygenase family protein n=1 Tax=Actinomadura rugatobispora TaxID=1994 RepID=A0ABW1AGE9_9ACTN|nr:2OG-Fe(II) oxygenase family protein [Actinomadura rugatobispora]
MTDLLTFRLPERVLGTPSDRELGRDMIAAWRADGVVRVATCPVMAQRAVTATAAGRRFFSLPLEYKARHVTDLSYSGYIAPGEDGAAGPADRSEIFTVCRDVPAGDARVREGWPCHGPVPWPDLEYRLAMRGFMDVAGAIGEQLLRLAALGLGLPAIDELTRLTRDGWHHMRMLRFPARSERTERAGTPARAGGDIGAHTDHGLLVIAAQDEAGGLYIRPPAPGEERLRSWLETESTAGRGRCGGEAPWTFVRPVPNVLTVFPGDIMQFLTGGRLMSTPHRIALGDREHYALAYFHEPGFETTVRAPDDLAGGSIHYGTHFTNRFMRCYPDHAATLRILQEGRLATLERLRAAMTPPS